MEKEPKHNICETIHSTVEGLYSGGTVDEETMRIYNEQCVNRPNESSDIAMVDHIKIVDVDTNEEVLNKRG